MSLNNYAVNLFILYYIINLKNELNLNIFNDAYSNSDPYNLYHEFNTPEYPGSPKVFPYYIYMLFTY